MRGNVIHKFNLMDNTNSQNSNMSGLIYLVLVQKRRPRICIAIANLKDVSYKYIAYSKICCKGVVTEFVVC